MSEDEGALANQTRKTIFNFILSTPGSSFSTLENALKMNRSTLKYHLHFLEKNQVVTSKKEGRKRCYYHNPDHPSLDLTLRTAADVNLGEMPKKQTRLFDLVRKHPGITQKQMIKRSKMKQSTVSHNLKRLLEMKLVWKVKEGGRTGYVVVTKQRLRTEIVNRLIIRLYRNEIDQETFLRIKKKLEALDNGE